MKCSEGTGEGGRGLSRGWGNSLYEHAVMHISVYTEAFDNCIHRIEYLNKYKKMRKIIRIRHSNRSQMKHIKRQQKQRVPSGLKKKSSRSAPICIFSVATVPIQVTEQPVMNRPNQEISRKTKSGKDLHTLQQTFTQNSQRLP